MILQTAHDVIEVLGGPAAVAEVYEVDYKTASGWQVIGAFPPKYFVAMTTELAKRGFRAPDRLWKMMERIS